MDAVAKMNEVIAGLQWYGIDVHYWPGWQSRGNGQVADYQGLIVHHTASGYGNTYPTLVDGRSDLSGPLCNFGGNADGSITIVAAHPANHAGASGGYNTSPLPVTSSFNKKVWGIEICYPGVSPMTDAQYRSAAILGAVISKVLGRPDGQWVKAHAETSVTGKWDPGYAMDRTIDMNAFRNTVKHYMNQNQGLPNPVFAPTTLTEDEVMYLFYGASQFEAPEGIAILSGSKLTGLGGPGSMEYNSALSNVQAKLVAAQWVTPGTFADLDGASHRLHDNPRPVEVVGES